MVTIISPHLDDAVLSCWHLLGRPGEVRVINVFAGSPGPRSKPAWWDRLTGASDSAQRMRERLVEDREALALVGRESLNLGFLEQQYRPDRQEVEPVVQEIASQLRPGTHVYGPAALLGRGDHAVVREATLRLRESGVRVSLYADLPHALPYGWPHWVTGGPQSLDVDAFWEHALAATGISLERLEPKVHELDPAERAWKLAAIRAYRSQLAALDSLFGGLDDSRLLHYEVSWDIAG